MEIEETMVEQQPVETAADDALQEGLTEVQDASESLESVLDDKQPAEEPEEKPSKQSTSEPGWIKKRINDAVSKASEQIRESIRAEYEQQYAPIREKLLDMEAQDLVKQGIVKSLDVAKELVRYRQGQSPAPTPEKQEQPRKSNGQYAPKEDAGTSAHIAMLQKQAEKIKAQGGPDVIEAFSSNEEIKRKVIAGEMDFYDVADELKKQTPKRGRPPAPMRSPNGASVSEKSTIATMSKEEFARLEKRLSEGARYNL